MKPTPAAAWTLAALLTLACADAGEEAEDATRQAPPAPAAQTRSPAAAPDTTAPALWAHLEEEAYRDTWRLWPGKGRLYEGTEPHGMLLTTYVNGTGYDALTAGGVADLPPGTLIVKENWMADSTFAAATVMYRVAGYNPDHEDWLFAKFDPQGTPEAFGRAEGCQACHQQAGSGYIYTAVEQP